MTKPAQIQPVAWLNTQHEPIDDDDFDIAGPIDGRKLNEVYPGRWVPLISIADIRSLLEAKAKDWDLRYGRGPAASKHNDKADELRDLAATLGNQEKRSD